MPATTKKVKSLLTKSKKKSKKLPVKSVSVKALAKVMKSSSISEGKSTLQRKSVTAPASNGMSLSVSSRMTQGPGKYPGSLRITASDLIAQIVLTNATTSPVTYPVATNLFNFMVSPSAPELSDTRTALFSKAYEKFIFEDMSFCYEPIAPSSQPGSIIMAFDNDVSDPTPPANMAGLSQYLSFQRSMLSSVWMPACLNAPLSDTQDFYYLGQNGVEERLENQGQFYVSLGSAVTVPASTTIPLANIIMRYNVVLFEPALEATVDVSSSLQLAPSVALPLPPVSSAGVPFSGGVQLPLLQTINTTDPGTYLGPAGSPLSLVGQPGSVLIGTDGKINFSKPGEYYFNALVQTVGGVALIANQLATLCGWTFTASPNVIVSNYGQVPTGSLYNAANRVSTFAQSFRVLVQNSPNFSSRTSFFQPIVNISAPGSDVFPAGSFSWANVAVSLIRTAGVFAASLRQTTNG